jgi:type II secretory pathway pseudopilin PulG
LAQEGGDTLIEVTFALAILGFVILSCTVLTSAAFRAGQTARERTEVSSAAQEQLEALHSFRDNRQWKPDFENKINAVATGFHMELLNTGPGKEWVPVAGPLTPSILGSDLTVPTSSLQIVTTTPANQQDCGYNFVLTYRFAPVGTTDPTNNATNAHNQITTRLANLKYDPSLGGSCP